MPSGEIAVLDGLAATSDNQAARDIADALLMFTSPGEDGAVTRRLARATWKALDRLPEVGATLHQLALVSAAAQTDDDENELDAAFVTDLDTLFAQTFPADRERRAAAVVAWREALGEAFDALKLEFRQLALGFSIVGATGTPDHLSDKTHGYIAAVLGRVATQPIEAIATKRERARRDRRTSWPDLKQVPTEKSVEKKPADAPVPEGHVLVCAGVGGSAGRHGRTEWGKGYEDAIGRPLPLVPVPDLARVQTELLADFPQAGDAIKVILGQVSRGRYLRLDNPILIEGEPGAGKSRFARRLAETLGVGLFRVDGTNDAGGSFGGTERRWYSAEPCRPFMAVARHRQANPMILIEESDKAAVRQDYGRLWDSILLFGERESSAHFQDPCLQAELDLSHVLIVLTANRRDGLPGPLLDRLKIVTFPAPGREHLPALAASVLREIATANGDDPRFIAPLAAFEIDALRRRWAGGSVRRLRRAVEAVLRARDSQRGLLQ
ncbi:AAA family ATPase [Enterovirga sp. CN4-39]